MALCCSDAITVPVGGCHPLTARHLGCRSHARTLLLTAGSSQACGPSPAPPAFDSLLSLFPNPKQIAWLTIKACCHQTAATDRCAAHLPAVRVPQQGPSRRRRRQTQPRARECQRAEPLPEAQSTVCFFCFPGISFSGLESHSKNNASQCSSVCVWVKLLVQQPHQFCRSFTLESALKEVAWPWSP